MTGLDTVPDGEMPQVNMQLLCDYCVGRTEFPIDVLAASEAPAEAIALVQSLLMVEPTARVTSSTALQSPWFSSIEFKNTWFKRLEADFSELGIALDIGTREDRALMRQIRFIDVARFLPTSTVDDMPVLLEQSIEKRLFNAVWMLINSPGRIVNDPLGVQRLFEQGVIEERLDCIRILVEVGKVDINRLCSSDGRKVLELAVQHGKCNIVQLLINNGAIIEPAADKSHEGRTIFQVAAGSGDIAMVKLLLKVSDDTTPIVNAIAAIISGRTALQAAAENGHIDMIRLLIFNGADINAKPAPESGRTALQAAAENGYLDIVSLLLETGAEPNARPSNVNGITALLAAVSNGHIDIVSVLLKYKSDVDYELDGATALHMAIQNVYPNIVQSLLMCRAKVYDTALQAAVETGCVELVQLLLEHKAIINDESVEPRDRTELQTAAGNGHIEVVRLLLDHGANINAKPTSLSGRTALQAAAEGGHLGVVDALLKLGAAVNDGPAVEHGRTALQAAAGNGHFDLVKLLLNHKAKINAKPAPHFGRTALQAAAEGGHLTIAEFLLQHKAKVNDKPSGHGGVSALGAAETRNDGPMIQLLQANGALDRVPQKTGIKHECGLMLRNYPLGAFFTIFLLCSTLWIPLTIWLHSQFSPI